MPRKHSSSFPNGFACWLTVDLNGSSTPVVLFVAREQSGVLKLCYLSS